MVSASQYCVSESNRYKRIITQETGKQTLPLSKWFLDSMKLLQRSIKRCLVSPTHGDIAESQVTLIRADAIYFVGYEWKSVALLFLNLNLPFQQCARREVLLIIQCNGTAKPASSRSFTERYRDGYRCFTSDQMKKCDALFAITKKRHDLNDFTVIGYP